MVEAGNRTAGFQAAADRIGVCGIAFGGGAQPGGQIDLAQAEGLGEQPLGLGRQALALLGQNQCSLRLLQLALRGQQFGLELISQARVGGAGFNEFSIRGRDLRLVAASVASGMRMPKVTEPP